MKPNHPSHCVRWVSSITKDPETLTPTRNGKVRGRPANPDGGSWQVMVQTKHCGVYYSSGFASRAQAAWLADLARFYMIYAGLMTAKRVVYNFPERIAQFDLFRDEYMIPRSLRYFVRENTAIFLGEPDPSKPLLP